jgi:hypothetical protein
LCLWLPNIGLDRRDVDEEGAVRTICSGLTRIACRGDHNNAAYG